jgi:hypothetical protein
MRNDRTNAVRGARFGLSFLVHPLVAAAAVQRHGLVEDSKTVAPVLVISSQ